MYALLLSALIVDQPTIEIRSMLTAQSRIVNNMINSLKPTSRTSDYYSLLVPTKNEGFIVGLADNHDGGTQTKVNVLVKCHDHKSSKYMTVENSYIATKLKICNQDDSTSKINKNHAGYIFVLRTQIAYVVCVLKMWRAI